MFWSANSFQTRLRSGSGSKHLTLIILRVALMCNPSLAKLYRLNLCMFTICKYAQIKNQILILFATKVYEGDRTGIMVPCWQHRGHQLFKPVGSSKYSLHGAADGFSLLANLSDALINSNKLTSDCLNYYYAWLLAYCPQYPRFHECSLYFFFIASVFM